MSKLSNIVVIYNPKSSGPSQDRAERLVEELREKGCTLDMRIIATEYAGHAEEIAYREGKAAAKPLIVSSSGDGGYHEVVNGVMRAQSEGGDPVASLLPSGNANDHWRTLNDKDLSSQILKSRISRIDLLHVHIYGSGVDVERYVHSYAGIGLTSHAGRTLNEHNLGHLRQIWLVLRSLFRAPAEIIEVEGKYRRYDSLTCANIGGMARYLSVSDRARPDDGRFEVVAMRRRNRLLVLFSLLQAATVGLKDDKQVESFNFRTVHYTNMQLDGEIIKVSSGAKVTISIRPQVLECVI